MKIVTSDDNKTVHVYLSESNLRSLLDKLAWSDPASHRTIGKDVDGITLVVTAERDIEHYLEHPRGVMHPRTEEALKSLDLDGGES